MNIESTSIIIWSYGAAAIAYFLFALYLRSLGKDWHREHQMLLLILVVITSGIWSGLSFAAFLSRQPYFAFAANLFDVLRHGAWYGFLLHLLRRGQTDGGVQLRSLLPNWLVAGCWITFTCGLAWQISLALNFLPVQQWLKTALFLALATPVLGLVLVEQLLRTISEDSIWNIKPLCFALLGQFCFDIYLFSNALMFNKLDADAVSIRGFVHAMTIPLLIVATRRSRDWTSKIRLSQKAAFHSLTLLLAGAYLLFMAGVGYYVRYFGGDWGSALELALICAAVLGLGILVASGSMRAKLRVLIGKHFFSYRYDYREEWLRFTRTLSSQESPQAMGQQVIRGLADMVESPAGGLWMRQTNQFIYRQTARWNMPESTDEASFDSSLPNFLMNSGWVINLEEYRCYPGRYDDLDIPQWLSELPNAWLVIPLMVGKQMTGFVVLASSRTEVDVNWEVNDLLRTAGCQAAGFLANMQATEALLEVRKFEAFNKMSAFVVHDLKNIVTQLALMLKNAERHSDNPEFQQDMLMTVEHAVDRMRQLMMQLREGATPPGAACGVNLSDVIQKIQTEKMKQGRHIDLCLKERLSARGLEERLHRVIGHLIQNALDATPDTGKVWVNLDRLGDRAILEVCDTGHGMTQEFIRDRLFRPFQTTKEAGMGIGAYESAQYIRELGGEIQVESELGKGTRIAIKLPIFEIQTESDLRQREFA